MTESLVVREVLDGKNYKTWRNCMRFYFLSQDLWDIIEVDEDESKSWLRKNALAMHAIHISCDASTLSQFHTMNSAKEVWNFLEMKYGLVDDDDEDDEQLSASSGEELEEPPSGDEDGIDYAPFVKAAKEHNWRDMEKFLDSHLVANVWAKVVNGQTALYYLVECGDMETGKMLAKKMKEKDVETHDYYQLEALESLITYNRPGALDLVKVMVSKNGRLPNLVYYNKALVNWASLKGHKKMTSYLYSVTRKDTLDPKKGTVGVDLLLKCMDIRLFDVAFGIVKKFPEILQQSGRGKNPIYLLVNCLSALQIERRRKKSGVFGLNHWWPKTWKCVKRSPGEGDEDVFEEANDEQPVYDQARHFLRLVCEQVSTFDIPALHQYVFEAMMEATKKGVAEFVSEMIIANSLLLNARKDRTPLFTHAVENRQEKIYSLICILGIRSCDILKSYSGNILHTVANLPPPGVLDRSSGPALQMQRELQWFEEVRILIEPQYREELNDKGLTPHELFTEAHAKLMEDGEKAMKETAQSSTVVGALIVTMMFAVAFAVPGGNNDTGLPIFLRKTLFRVFIVSDALSLYSSTTSVLVFLGILTSRYAEQDFLLKLPRKMIIGLATLFFSITTMMISFCTALALMLDGELQYILPTVLLACVPVVMFMSSIVPVMSEMFMSTFGPSIFDKNRELYKKMIETNRVKDRKLAIEGEAEARNDLLEDTNVKEDENMTYDPSSANMV